MSKSIRVRFAPSPTGFVHVGSLRTALYNYLFAKKMNGKFILRIEDTDRNRYVENSVENIIKIMNMFNLNYDEGPGKEKENISYFQSERNNLYKKYSEKLLEQEDAYYCFCSSDDLTKMREEQISSGLTAKYDGRCKLLDKDKVRENIQDGLKYVIRMKTPEDGSISFDDLIRGKVTVNWQQIDDQVLIKSDGYPTYHLANVVDDHYMNITHVIRGEEWISSTPKHLLLYKYFNWQAPLMAHMPLLLNPDKSKLSKRQGDVAVEDYLENGYLVEALTNFVALLGWHPSNDREFYNLQELEQEFSLDRINKAGSVFDREKLDWMNGWYIRNSDLDYITEKAKKYFLKENIDISDKEKYRKVISTARDYVLKLSDFPEKSKMYYQDLVFNQDDLDLFKKTESQSVFKYMLEILNLSSEFNLEQLSIDVKKGMKLLGIKGKDYYFPLRLALYGSCHGPDIPTLIEVLGKEKAIERIKNVIISGN